MLKSLLEKYGNDVALLMLRVGFGGFLAVNHGWTKLMTWGPKHPTFADPLGVGHPTSMALAIFGELVCSMLIVLGLGTRVAAVPALITMLVAALGVHKDSVFGDGEHALLYGAAFVALILAGGGRYSLDRVVSVRWKAP